MWTYTSHDICITCARPSTYIRICTAFAISRFPGELDSRPFCSFHSGWTRFLQYHLSVEYRCTQTVNYVVPAPKPNFGTWNLISVTCEYWSFVVFDLKLVVGVASSWHMQSNLQLFERQLCSRVFASSERLRWPSGNLSSIVSCTPCHWSSSHATSSPCWESSHHTKWWQISLWDPQLSAGCGWCGEGVLPVC